MKLSRTECIDARMSIFKTLFDYIMTKMKNEIMKNSHAFNQNLPTRLPTIGGCDTPTPPLAACLVKDGNGLFSPQ